MTPLDLTKGPPRAPREEVRGLCMLPRMIDIARAMLPGGRMGDYQIGRGMSGVVFSAFGVSTDEFVELVRRASTDADVAAAPWSRRSVPAAALSRRLQSVTVSDVPDDLRADFQRLYGSDHSPEERVFDILETDDANAFTRTA